ncbi:ArsC/Spx/MgsR family protein [Robiginitomaculum antarcticum]|uniref:ArsC/Spx/MgsR family protein n=1 Tax=Robiginitomaculum antarcticum TaxID=437507 RepID=UPI00035E2C1F|nr:ArsC/Spx/MgsR family protein [Robiginitomaculum antarcticum]
MTYTLYGLKNCDMCRKAVKALEGVGKKVTFVDIRGEGVDARKIEDWADEAGWDTLLNKRSTTWRKLSEADKTDIDEEKAVKLMAAHRALIKRPVVQWGNEIFVGWGTDTQDALL